MRVNAQAWQEFLDTHYPQAHLLQTAAWGTLKRAFGWQPEYLVVGTAGAQILFRELPLGFTVAYIPKGPLGKPDLAFWKQADTLCRQRRAIFLRVEPDFWEDAPPFGGGARPLKARPAPQAVQPRRTLVVDLTPDEDAILGRMKQKTRYNIRLAMRKGVRVRPSDDLPAFHALMQTTGERDNFGIHSLEYYRRAYDLFHPLGACELLLAEYEGQPLAGLMVFAWGKRAWYFYGASNNQERNRMPTYLLQWEAMRWARNRGCTSYDLWGVPDEDEAVLEAAFTERREGLWGVYRFKRGFGGQLKRAAPPLDRVYRPILYAAYRRWARRGKE
ncbi:MAG TPA: peptidoglycan bridge formation glycyltransferase FemA/FemB family protein [Chloroflexi bacterium]|nr:peptidoglycan bridge formation glycyltransferase FemA/FemB family protein [Chloroflexota bacterium]